MVQNSGMRVRKFLVSSRGSMVQTYFEVRVVTGTSSEMISCSGYFLLMRLMMSLLAARWTFVTTSAAAVTIFQVNF